MSDNNIIKKVRSLMSSNKKDEEVKMGKQQLISELEEEMRVLKGIQSAMPDPYYVRDMDYNVILWPDAIQKLTGYSEEEAKRIKCEDIFKAGVCEDCPTQKSVMNREFLKDAAVDVYTKSGDKLNTLVSNAGVYNENGEPIGAVEIVKDNTLYHTISISLRESSEQLSANSEELAATSEEVSSMSYELADQSEEVLRSTKSGLANAVEVNDKANDCMDFAEKVQDSMQTIIDTTNETTDVIHSLEEKSEDIGSIISDIKDIASQTNLLALNAAIEAARAGEAGRGFSVVADEIRDLSEESDSAVNRIQDIIEENLNLVGKSTESAKRTKDSIVVGKEMIEKLIGYVSNISEVSLKLSEIMKENEEAMQKTNDITENQKMAINEVSQVSQDLASMAEATHSELEKLTHINM